MIKISHHHQRIVTRSLKQKVARHVQFVTCTFSSRPHRCILATVQKHNCCKIKNKLKYTLVFCGLIYARHAKASSTDKWTNVHRRTGFAQGRQNPIWVRQNDLVDRVQRRIFSNEHQVKKRMIFWIVLLLQRYFSFNLTIFLLRNLIFWYLIKFFSNFYVNLQSDIIYSSVSQNMYILHHLTRIKCCLW